MIEGLALKYEYDDVNTDVIWPGKYTYLQIPTSEMRKYAMETMDPDFKHKVKHHSILVVGRNFGCGSSREQAAECLKYSGVKAIVAASFARIFFRNAINIGLPAIESAQSFDLTKDASHLRIDLKLGRIEIDGELVEFPPFPDQVIELIEHDGLINLLRSRK